MKRAALFLVLFAAALSARATNVSGNITANTTWTVAGSPYILSGDVCVCGSASPVLTIEPGVTVQGNANAHLLINFYEKGAMVVNGTAEEPVVFTANGSTSPGFWQGMHYGTIAGGPASSMSYTTVEYAGSTGNAVGAITVRAFSPLFDHVTLRASQHAGLRVEGGTPVVTASTMRDNTGHGIYVTGGSPSLTDVAFISNSSKAMSVAAGTQLSGMTGISATGNGTNVIEYRGGDITASRTWKTSAVPYLVTGAIYVKAASAPILTIEPGNTIRFGTDARIAVNYQDKGGLAANGTEAAPILFTSHAASPTPGSWWGLYFGDVAGNTPSSVTWATIEYGGLVSDQRGGVSVYGGAPVFDHVTIRNCAYAGAALHGGSASFLDSTITGNGGSGIRGVNPVALTMTNTAFTNNNGYAVSVHASTAFAGVSGLTASGNGTGRDAIEMRGGDINVSRTWKTSALPYVVTGSIHVKGGGAPILTIEAGNTIRFNDATQIAVNYQDKGGLAANGTAGAPILFTSNNASPVAGSWWGLYFGETGGNTPSSISHATIEWGGLAPYQRGGITVYNVSPVLDHVTIRKSAYAGVSLHGAGATFTDCSITANSGPGIRTLNPATLTLTGTSFTNNDGYAVTAHAATTFLSTSGLSASGNGTGRDGIEMRQGVITSDRTWPTSAIPWIVSGNLDVQGSSGPVLTIAAGNTVRFNNGSQLAINHSDKGALRANGTAAAPILFTSNGAATPGQWLGIWIGPAANPPQSSISYATVAYGGSDGYARGGIAVNAGAPVFDHLTLRDNLYAGFSASGGVLPRITNSHFLSNPAGVRTSWSAVVDAKLNFWSAAAGPCSPGSCATGQQSVVSGVLYEPWLISAPTDPQFVTGSTQKNRVFSPAIGAQTTVDYTTALAGDVTVTIRNSAQTVVRTFTSSGSAGSFAWNGRNDSNVVQPDGAYSFEIAATAASQPPAAIARGVAVVDNTRALALSAPAISLAYFSPNGDSTKDTVSISASTNYDDTAWTVSVLDASSNVVRTQSGSSLNVSYVWDGRNGSNAVQPDGLYTLRIDAAQGTATAQGSGTTILDNTPPVASISTPAASAVLSNVYSSGVTEFNITGSVTDTHLEHWVLDKGTGASPASWWPMQGGNSPVTNGWLGRWQSWFDTNGAYAFRIYAIDRAGNRIFTPAHPVTLGHFRSSQNKFQFNASTGGNVTYTSIVPFPLTETIVLKNEAGAVVRTLVNAVARNGATYNDSFDGRNDANALLPDGAYFYFATVTDGTSTFTWDLSSDHRGDFSSFNDNLNIQAYDPFNNKPMKFNYNFAQPARVTIAISTNPGVINGNCNNPTPTFFCAAIDRYEPSGQSTFTWSGIDHTGAYRVARSVGIVAVTNNFPENGVVVYGAKPTVANVKVTPPVFGPAAGTQAIEFDLTTYASQSADVSIALINLSTLSTLRTLTLPGQAAGHSTVTWDGRADNGMYVAPGFYRVLVTATDQQGNVAKSDILTTIQY